MTAKFHFTGSTPLRNMILFLLFSASASVYADAINLPHEYPRSSENLLSNPSFVNGSAPWSLAFDSALYAGPTYDSTESHTPGSGSIKFPSAATLQAKQIKSERITNFKYNTPYTISYYMKTQHEPVYTFAVLHTYDAQGKRTFSSSTGRGATSATGEWQEVVCVATITDTNVKEIQVVIEIVESASYQSAFYFDDIYFGEGISFSEAPAFNRTTFNGANVKVDALGNWGVYEDSAWKDFFPFGLYADLGRTDYMSLSAQGFNVVMSQQFRSQVQKAKDASSGFNPRGMRAGLRMSKYATPNDPYWTLTQLTTMINDINGPVNNLSDTLLFYDWDNENNWTTWSLWFDMVSVVRSNDTNHPIYILNGDPAVQRLFDNLSDVSGTYTGFEQGSALSSFGKFEILQNLQAQTVPVSIAQINVVEEANYGFRLRVYDALIKGARGVVYFGDTPDHVENRMWWPDVANLRREIDVMMPIIKQPHWTSWSAVSSDKKINFGTRDYNGDGYIVVMNAEDSESLSTFSITGRDAKEVRNYFDNSNVASVNNGAFTVVLPANSTAVYKLPFVSRPDLVVSTVDGPTSGIRGANIAINTMTANTGSAAAAASTTALYLSTDATITTADTRLGAISFGSFAVGTSMLNSTSVKLPSTLVTGTYYLGAIADDTGMVEEGNTTGTGESNNAKTGNAIQIAGVPAAPGNLAATVNSTSKITLTWTDNATDETSFKIERSTNGTRFSQIATVGPNVKTYASSGLKSNTSYYYRVRAYNSRGNSTYSNTVSARTNP